MLNNPTMRLRLKDLRAGDVFYECNHGADAKCKMLSDPETTINGHKARVEILGVAYGGRVYPRLAGMQRESEFFECDPPGTYGLKLYDKPQYFGEEIFKLHDAETDSDKLSTSAESAKGSPGNSCH